MLVLVLVVVMSCAACGEPGEPSPDIALQRTSDGRLLLIYRVCPDTTPDEIVVGNGLDRWAEPMLSLKFKEVPGHIVEVNLASPDSKRFEIARTQAPFRDDVPLFVRVGSDAGTQAQIFEEGPPNGLLRYEPFGSREQENVEPERFKNSPPEECS